MLFKTKTGVTVRAFQLQTSRRSIQESKPFGEVTEEESLLLKERGALCGMVASIRFDRSDEGWSLTYQGLDGKVNLKGGDAVILDENGAFHPIKKNLFELLFEKVEE